MNTIIPYKNAFIGTSFFGDTIKANCNQLKDLFGNYQESDPHKVNFEWDLLIKEKEIPFTIYDWKEPWLDEYMVTEYHIGARNAEESKIAVDLVNQYLENNKNTWN